MIRKEKNPIELKNVYEIKKKISALQIKSPLKWVISEHSTLLVTIVTLNTLSNSDPEDGVTVLVTIVTLLVTIVTLLGPMHKQIKNEN